MAALTLDNGRTFVYVADYSDAIGIAEVNPDGSLTNRGRITNTASSRRLDDVKEVEIVEVGGQAFLVALSPGSSDTLTAYRINNDGSLTATDTIVDGTGSGENFLDGGGSSIGEATTLSAFTNSSGQTYLLSGTDDAGGGVALWSLNANGQISLQDTRAHRELIAAGDDFVTDDNELGLNRPNASAFTEIDGETYVFVGGADQEIAAFRIDPTGSNRVGLSLVQHSENVVTGDISSMAILPTGELVIGGEAVGSEGTEDRQGLIFYNISVLNDGSLGLAQIERVIDENDPNAELFDSEDIDIEGGILVSASDNDNGVAVIDLYDTATRNLVVNGSFEDTTGMTETGFGFTSRTGQVPGWTWFSGSLVPSPDGQGGKVDVVNSEIGGVTASEGNNYLDLEGNADNIQLGQDIQGMVDGETYRLGFDINDSLDKTQFDVPEENRVLVWWNGEQIADFDPSTGINGAAWDRYAFDIVAGSGDGSNRLIFGGVGQKDNVGASVDNVSITQIIDGEAPIAVGQQLVPTNTPFRAFDTSGNTVQLKAGVVHKALNAKGDLVNHIVDATGKLVELKVGAVHKVLDTKGFVTEKIVDEVGNLVTLKANAVHSVLETSGAIAGSLVQKVVVTPVAVATSILNNTIGTIFRLF